jgi:hypothetical protein
MYSEQQRRLEQCFYVEGKPRKRVRVSRSPIKREKKITKTQRIARVDLLAQFYTTHNGEDSPFSQEGLCVACDANTVGPRKAPTHKKGYDKKVFSLVPPSGVSSEF